MERIRKRGWREDRGIGGEGNNRGKGREGGRLYGRKGERRRREREDKERTQGEKE